MINRFFLGLSALLLACTAAAPAFALRVETYGVQCTQPDGAEFWEQAWICPSGTMVWQRPAYQFGTSLSQTCNAGLAGMVQWTGTAVSPNNSLRLCDGTSWAEIGSSGNFLGASATQTNPSRSDDVTTGLFSHTASTVSLATNGTQALFVSATQSVGIGTATPQSKLDVNGGVKIGNNTGSCSSANNGEIKYVSGTTPPWNYCNGSNWVPFESAGYIPAYTIFSADSFFPGYYSVLAIKNGTLYGWGYNTQGRLATGSSTATIIPKPAQAVAAFAESWQHASTGVYHSCGIKTDNSLWCWGYNGTGALGTGNTTSYFSAPVQVTGTWSQITTGGYWNGIVNGVSLVTSPYTCGIKTDSSLWCWGNNTYGQLGDGTTTQRLSPVQVTGSWIAISTNILHTCGIKTDNSLWCWGFNTYGQIGDGTTTDSSSPVQIAGSWLSVETGWWHTCGIKTDNSLWCWGNNSSGKLGDGTTTSRTSPVQITGSWLSVTAGMANTCGIKQSDGPYCWGDNTYGQVGASSTAINLSTPTALTTSSVLTGSSWTVIKARGYSFVCGQRDDNSVWCWGNNNFAVLGDPNWGQYFTPVGG